MITYKLLERYNEIAHFCTSREGGVSMGNYASFNLSPFCGDAPESLSQNQQILCDQLGINLENLILPYQNHGTEVREIDEAYFHLSKAEKLQYLNGIDALYTNLPGICIGVTTADCVPLLFYDPVKQVVAAAHAGWRGTCGLIAEKTIRRLVEVHKCSVKDILAVIGPSISSEVYEVGVEVIDSFKVAGFDVSNICEQREGSFFLDLWKANQQSLEKAGIPAENIEIAGLCTFTSPDRFFSARRLGIKSGRMLSGIMIKKS
ncbi:protein of unknown function DUF152 [Paludibacter propionicigenes WB4]|uniref:Purine nucleoside phosphorylase n=1 Tax=Paludibacter propionicigenes (strain DSM 17365 / JCM 13257 / WB4) TaxID=694427 RepID=E4T6Y5_PALPW|nr:peptidoglycan editing factor PgeF [Paludibacter propionicigenes]ADQ80479.1 protein of unknown function DUF152 [Paludibacter propionicigenes WB4]